MPERSTPQRKNRRVGAEPGTSRHRRPLRATRLALVFVAAVLVAILVVPLVIHRRADTLRDQASRLAEPARESSEAISRALAIEVAADRAYQLTGRAEFRTRFDQAWAQQEGAFDRLARLAPALGGDVAQRAGALRAAVEAWAQSPLRTLRGAGSPGEIDARLDAQQRLFERTVAAAVSLDDAIHTFAEHKRAEAARIASIAAVATVALSGLALCALIVVAWLARELGRLANEEAQMRGELQRLFAARDRLIRGFSHDVKNPLGAADGFAQLLETGMIPDPAKQREALARMRRSIRTALRLIEDILELARAEAGQLQLQIAPVDLVDVVAETADEYRAQAAAAGMTLSLDAPGPVCAIRSDRARIHQILGNLLSNAIKYAGSGGAAGMRVAADRRWPGERGTDWLRVEVWDRGPGIPADALENVFDEFTRLRPELHDGAGLGLAISRRLARALGGEITVESEPGGGTRFILWLPAVASLAA